MLTTAATAEKQAATYSVMVGPFCGAMPKINATSAAPRVCPVRRAVPSIPLAPPLRSRGAADNMVRLFGDWKIPKPAPHSAMRHAICMGSGCAPSVASNSRPAVIVTSPTPPSQPDDILSDSTPAIGAAMMMTAGHGVISKPVSTCDKPSVSCNRKGNDTKASICAQNEHTEVPIERANTGILSKSIGTSVCSFCAQMLAFVSLPFLLQDTLGFSQVDTGLLMTPWPAVIIIAAPIAGVLSDKVSSGWLGGVGLAAMTVGLLLLATLGAHPEPMQIAWRMALCGAGFGIFQSPNNRTMLSAAPRERSGGASGMLGTARLTGQTLGAALVALIFGIAPQNGPIIVLYVAACFSAVAAVVSTSRVMQRA